MSRVLLALVALTAAAVVSLPLASSAAPLSLHASSSILCPVIRYDAVVEELPVSSLAHMHLSALLRDEAAAAPAVGAKPYRVTLAPISYVHNSSLPPIDWVDLHFRVNSQAQQNVQMKPASEARVYEFAPIFLAPTDELTFAHTISASMINCDTATQTFKPIEPKLGVAKPIAPAAELPAAVAPAPAAALPSSSSALPVELQSTHELIGACPAIAFTHKVSCGDANCKLSFVNLSPEKTIEWVDMHVSSDAASFLKATGTPLSSSGVAPRMIVQNHRMLLGAGAAPKRLRLSMSLTAAQEQVRAQQEAAARDQLNSAAEVQMFGAESAPTSILAATAASQVWQFGLPLAFRDSDRLAVAFTYNADGIDCDTNTFTYTIKDDKESKRKEA